MLRRVLGSSRENVKARGCCSGQLDSAPVPHPKSSQVSEKIEPLVDVFEDEESIVVVAELIGIDKSDIDLHATQDKLTISVDSADFKYRREIELPARVDVGSSSSRLKNGVLEIRLKKLGQELVIR
jgi:HSP20 family molecular chaperone IbpA